MRLRDLEAHFTKYEERPRETFEHFTVEELRQQNPLLIDRIFVRVDTFEAADGFRFQCPKCKAPGAYAHLIYIGFEGRAAPGTYGHNKDGVPVLWQVIGGSSLDDLALAPSIQIQGGCNWHGFVGSSGVPPGEAA